MERCWVGSGSKDKRGSKGVEWCWAGSEGKDKRGSRGGERSGGGSEGKDKRGSGGVQMCWAGCRVFTCSFRDGSSTVLNRFLAGSYPALG